LLADSSAEQLRAVGARWAETEEFALERWPADAVQEGLAQLAALCHRAREQGESVFMWMSL
jgi:hypothetical protein